MNPTDQLIADALNAACVLESYLGDRSSEVASVRRIIARIGELEAKLRPASPVIDCDYDVPSDDVESLFGRPLLPPEERK